ncbi:hypothetical protein T8T21_05670 [Limimaricola variabilis]|uniref:hypothetical protein n=1 Tax=Limimaricola variabilis TaxID=1492771 RepID=UPI002AC8BE0D|nr:hypothetical protein [Limimaricola variabilis]WPY95611.1 hypothetical protein T8T21_05670 [Limimaricola variabilis]
MIARISAWVSAMLAGAVLLLGALRFERSRGARQGRERARDEAQRIDRDRAADIRSRVDAARGRNYGVLDPRDHRGYRD